MRGIADACVWGVKLEVRERNELSARRHVMASIAGQMTRWSTTLPV